MKKSKIIFISLLAVIAMFILAASIDYRLTGSKIGLVPANIKVTKETILQYKVLSLENSDIRLFKNDTLFIEITSLKDSALPKLNYNIKNDTLFIKDSKLMQGGRVSVSIHVNSSVKAILLKNSNLTMEHFQSGNLNLGMDNSYIWLNQDKSSFNNLNILARNHSSIESVALNVDSLGIILDHSEANIGIIARKITSSLSDSSRLYVRQAGDMLLKKDPTSSINVNDY
jgi:hypothetical protein